MDAHMSTWKPTHACTMGLNSGRLLEANGWARLAVVYSVDLDWAGFTDMFIEWQLGIWGTRVCRDSACVIFYLFTPLCLSFSLQSLSLLLRRQNAEWITWHVTVCCWSRAELILAWFWKKKKSWLSSQEEEEQRLNPKIIKHMQGVINLCGSWLLIRLITKATTGVLEKQNTMFCFYGNVVFYMQTLLNQTMMPSATLQPNTLLAIPTWAWDKS